MKRFWDSATLAPTANGLQLLLDGKPMRLPDGNTLTISHPALAEAIRDEWQSAGGAKGGDFIHGTHLPLTQLHTTATHRIGPNRDAIISAIAAYGESDLLCYRATTPEPLRHRQIQAWQPWLDWSADVLNAPLHSTNTITHIAQPPASLANLTSAVAACTDHELAALGVVVPATGSLVLGLALLQGALTPETTHAIATVDDQYQTEFWGVDDEAKARTDNIAADIVLAAKFLKLIRNPM